MSLCRLLCRSSFCGDFCSSGGVRAGTGRGTGNARLDPLPEHLSRRRLGVVCCTWNWILVWSKTHRWDNEGLATLAVILLFCFWDISLHGIVYFQIGRVSSNTQNATNTISRVSRRGAEIKEQSWRQFRKTGHFLLCTFRLASWAQIPKTRQI